MTRLTTVGLRDSTEPVSSLQVIQWAVAGGSVNAITAAYETAVDQLVDGMVLAFRALGANTSATPTFSPDGLTAHTITKQGGVALLPGDIPKALAEVIVRYNEANTRWELVTIQVSRLPWIVAGGTADAITATYSPATPALVDGLLLTFRAASANSTTTPTFAPNGLTARTIVKDGGVALVAGNIAAGGEYIVRYNLASTRWELLNPTRSPDISAAITANNSSLNLVQELFRNRGSDDTGTNVNTAQPWFPTQGSVTVASDTSYFMDGILYLSRAAGTTSHTTGILFGGTAVLQDILYFGTAKTGDANDLQTISGFWATAATSLVLKAASISATEQAIFMVRGTVRVTTGGTFIPQFIYSSAPGGAPTIKKGSYFRLHPFGNAAAAAQGTWA